MKTLTVTLLLLCCHRSQGSFVVDLNDASNENTFLGLDKGIEINNPLSFCLRFNIKSPLETNYIFSSKDNKLGLTLRFSVRLGIVYLNSDALIFEIPKDNDVSPFHWHHICVSSSKDFYNIVLDGQQWFCANHTQRTFEKTIVKRLDLGSTNGHSVYSDGIKLIGLLSELNVWSKSLSAIQMVEITRNCRKVDPLPDILNWSKLPKTMIGGSKYNETIENTCPQRNSTLLTYKIMPEIHDHDNAMHICKILNGELAFPNSIDEFQSWNGKLAIMKCKNINNNFTLLIIIFFSSNCIKKCMSSFHGTNEKVIK